MMTRMRVGVTMLARATEKGRVKTRLAASTGDQAACAIHEAMLLDAVEEAAAWLAARASPRLVLALDGSVEARRRLQDRVDAIATCRIEEQPQADLGERMRVALERRLGGGCEASLVVGSDCPMLREPLAAAASALGHGDAVLIPAQDGGFVLMGLRRGLAQGSRDGLPWGSSTALSATVGRLASLGLTPSVIGAGQDVDDVAALAGLALALDREPPGRAPRTREELRRLGHLPVVPGGNRDTIAR